MPERLTFERNNNIDKEPSPEETLRGMRKGDMVLLRVKGEAGPVPVKIADKSDCHAKNPYPYQWIGVRYDDDFSRTRIVPLSDVCCLKKTTAKPAA
ncbi:MAG: hypothetical protein PHU56_00020 [Candidatus Pacebacteria bacterium]|nr:hypothetical protein [Candidatus Paceibacterota bacterium]